ncbi:MAG: ATP-binding protein, partial [Prevotellaceae bacterium]|nr:ATP-binding protein [Prevotellaceae bacterium]
LISTMEAYFEGKRELFSGLELERLEKDWTNYPVLHLDLNTGKYDSKETLEYVLDDALSEWENIYGSTGKTLDLRFKEVVRNAYEKTGQKVVILVDEYDKPMLEAINDKELQEQYRRTLKAFYSVLKTQDRYIRFAFLTGVTKFSKVSIFSDLNNLKDITMDERYADICGISEKELHAYFEGPIKELAAANGMTYEQACAKMKEQYDGYHFAPDTAGMYNPFSLLNALCDRKLKDYWFQTGTPTFLVSLLKESDYDLRNLQEERVSSNMLGDVDTMDASPIPVLYQSGYLTIKDYDAEFDTYALCFPNREVEKGFTDFLAPYYTKLGRAGSGFFIGDFVMDVRQGRPEDFMTKLQAMLDDGDYRIAGKFEKYFQNTLYVVFKMMGFYTQVERATSQGRIDVVVQTKDYVYVMELKVDTPAEEALAQIDSKGYALPYSAEGRKVFKIGVNFSSGTRRIAEWKCETE